MLYSCARLPLEEPGISLLKGALTGFSRNRAGNLDPQFPDEPEEFVLSKLFHDLVLAEPDLLAVPAVSVSDQFAVFAADKACAEPDPAGGCENRLCRGELAFATRA